MQGREAGGSSDQVSVKTMRTTTRRKTYGRSNMAQAVRAALHGLEEALVGAAPEPPLVLAIRKTIVDLNRALESYRVYGMTSKRIHTEIETEKARLSDLLNRIVALPITQEEKLAVRGAQRRYPKWFPLR